MKRVITLTGLAMAIGLATMGAQAADYVAGKDYRVLDNPEKISGDAIIVREFFWYGCGHCFAFEPMGIGDNPMWRRTNVPSICCQACNYCGVCLMGCRCPSLR